MDIVIGFRLYFSERFRIFRFKLRVYTEVKCSWVGEVVIFFLF